MLAKLIDEGKREHEELEIFIIEFRTTNELLLKERRNLLSELKIEVNELSKVMGNVLIPKSEVKGLTTREGNMTSEATTSKEINEIGINKNEPSILKQDVQEKPHDDGVKNKSSSIHERTTEKLVKPQQSFVPFPNRVLSSLAQQTAIKRKRPHKFHYPLSSIGKHKEAKDLAADNSSRLENPHTEVLTEREIADKFFDEHLMALKSKSSNDEPWTAYKTLTGCTPFRIVYGKECHLPIEIEHKAHWALKQYNIDLTLASKSGLMQLNELAKLRDGAYENTRIYKERTKKWHDYRLRGDKDFKDLAGKKSTKVGGVSLV
ncbi:hypothetical protein Tco_0517619 [Tanacetum coccineum]